MFDLAVFYSLLWMLPHVLLLSNHSFGTFQNITTKTSLFGNPSRFTHWKLPNKIDVDSFSAPTYFARNLSLLSFPVVSRYGRIFTVTLSYTLSVDFLWVFMLRKIYRSPHGPYRLGFGFPFSASVDGAAGPVHVWTP